MPYFKKTILIPAATTCNESQGQDRCSNHISIHHTKSARWLQNSNQNDRKSSKEKMLEHFQDFKTTINRTQSTTRDTWQSFQYLLQLNSIFGMYMKFVS